MWRQRNRNTPVEETAGQTLRKGFAGKANWERSYSMLLQVSEDVVKIILCVPGEQYVEGWQEVAPVPPCVEIAVSKFAGLLASLQLPAAASQFNFVAGTRSRKSGLKARYCCCRVNVVQFQGKAASRAC